MKAQKIEGGQLNDTLVEGTNVDWCFLMPVECEETVEDVATLYSARLYSSMKEVVL